LRLRLEWRVRCQFAETVVQAGDERRIFLSTMPATIRDRGTALAVVGISAILFLCVIPFAAVPLPPVPAFIASYQSALAINDLITAILLFSQYGLLRSRALLLLASGYCSRQPRSSSIP